METAIIYPNPAKDILNLKIAATDNKAKSIEIYNLFGEKCNINQV